MSILLSSFVAHLFVNTVPQKSSREYHFVQYGCLSVKKIISELTYQVKIAEKGKSKQVTFVLVASDDMMRHTATVTEELGPCIMYRWRQYKMRGD